MATDLEKNCTLKFSDDVAMTAALREATKVDREVVEQIREEVEGIDQSFQEEKAEIDIKHADVVLKHGEVITAKNEVDTTKAEIDGIQTNINSQQTDITTKRDEVNTTHTLVQQQAAEVKTNTDQVAQDKIEIDQKVADFDNTAATKKQEIIDEGNSQITKVTNKGTEQNNLLLATGATEQQQVQQEGSAQISLINTLSTNEQAEITTKGDAEVARVEAEGTAQEGRVTSAGNSELVDITNKATEQVARVTTAGDAEVARVDGSGDIEIAQIIAEGDIQEARAKVEADRAKAESDDATTEANRATTEANKAKTEADRATTEANKSATNSAAATAAQTAAETAQAGSETARDEAVAIVHDGEGSLVPGAGKYAIADSEGHFDKGWFKELDHLSVVDDVSIFDGEVNVKGTSTFDGEVNVKDQINLPEKYGIDTNQSFVVIGEGSYGYTPKCAGNDGYLPIPKWTGKGDFEIELSVVYVDSIGNYMLFDNTDVSDLDPGNCTGIYRIGSQHGAPNRIECRWKNDQLNAYIDSQAPSIPDSGILHTYRIVRSGLSSSFYDNGVLIHIDNTVSGSYSINRLMTGYNSVLYKLTGQMHHFKMTDHTTPKNSRHYDLIKKQLTVPADSELFIPDLLDTGVYRFTPAFRPKSNFGEMAAWTPTDYSNHEIIIEFMQRSISGNYGTLFNRDVNNSINSSWMATFKDYRIAVFNFKNILIDGNANGTGVIKNGVRHIVTCKLDGDDSLRLIGGRPGSGGSDVCIDGQIYLVSMIDNVNPTNSRYYDFTQLATVAPDDGDLVVQEGELQVRTVNCSPSSSAMYSGFSSLLIPEGFYKSGIPCKVTINSIGSSVLVNGLDIGVSYNCLSEVTQFWDNDLNQQNAILNIFGARNWIISGNMSDLNVTVEYINPDHQLIDQTDYRNSLTSSDASTVTVNADSVVFDGADSGGHYAKSNSNTPIGSIVSVSINIKSISSGGIRVLFVYVGGQSDIISTETTTGIKTNEVIVPDKYNGENPTQIFIDADLLTTTATIEDISITVSYPCTLTGFSSPVWEKVVGETGPGVLTNFPVTQEVDQGDYRNSIEINPGDPVIVENDRIIYDNASSFDFAKIKDISNFVNNSEITLTFKIEGMSSGSIWLATSGNANNFTRHTNNGTYTETITVDGHVTLSYFEILGASDQNITISDISITIRRPGNTDPVWEKLDPAYVGELLGVSSDRLQYMGEDLRTVNDGGFDVPVELKPSAVPENPQPGTFYFDSGTSKFMGYNGTGWVELG